MQNLCRTPGLPHGTRRRRLLAQALIAIAALVSMMALAACGPTAPPPPAASPAASPRMASPAASPRMASPAASPMASPGAPAGAPRAPTTVEMTADLKFVPEHVTIKKGGTITWRDTSALVHTVTDDPTKATDPANSKLPNGAKAWDSGNIDPGQSFTHTFDVEGDYTYFCIPHESAGMVGTITVQP